MNKILKKPIKKKAKKTLSTAEKAQIKEQNDHRSGIINILKNIGFSKLNYIDGKEFIFKGRTSEMDDIFIYENVILITEYTIGDPGTHLLKKNYFYENVQNDPREFINFMLKEEKLSSFRNFYNDNILNTYTNNQLVVCILYCSKKTINTEHKNQVKNISYFDYDIVQYFKSLTKVIKKSSKYEFFDFLKISLSKIGNNVFKSSQNTIQTYSGHILPEEKSKYNTGYKIISFYIDAESLLKRAFVLRQEGWRDKENIGYYQRMIDSKKISGMRKYLTEKDRVFINNIIATISVDNLKLFDESNNEFVIDQNGQFTSQNQTVNVTPTKIEISDKCNIIGLIDGQHRTYAYHEGNDQYEDVIKKLRTFQNLLVTAIIFPSSESKQKRLKFEANLFLEINSNQTNVKSQLKQEIATMITPFSTTAISKQILLNLNANGPLSNLIEVNSYEKGKIKTASIVSFGLNSLIKTDNKKIDSLFILWDASDKDSINLKDAENYNLLNDYIKYCTENIRDLFIAFKRKISKEKWCSYSYHTPEGILNVTFINGVLNVMRLLVENDKLGTVDEYSEKIDKINQFDFKSYKSSQYRKMGLDIFDKYFI